MSRSLPPFKIREVDDPAFPVVATWEEEADDGTRILVLEVDASLRGRERTAHIMPILRHYRGVHALWPIPLLVAGWQWLTRKARRHQRFAVAAGATAVVLAASAAMAATGMLLRSGDSPLHVAAPPGTDVVIGLGQHDDLDDSEASVGTPAPSSSRRPPTTTPASTPARSSSDQPEPTSRDSGPPPSARPSPRATPTRTQAAKPTRSARPSTKAQPTAADPPPQSSPHSTTDTPAARTRTTSTPPQLPSAAPTETRPATPPPAAPTEPPTNDDGANEGGSGCKGLIRIDLDPLLRICL
jgi:hypothetical protein